MIFKNENLVKVGQIWISCIGVEPYDWTKTISFRINEVKGSIIYGIVTECNLYNQWYSPKEIGVYFSVHKDFFNKQNYRLEKDIVGFDCWKCGLFYNESKFNQCRLGANINNKFICWKCEISEIIS